MHPVHQLHPNTPFCNKCNVPAKIGQTIASHRTKTQLSEGSMLYQIEEYFHGEEPPEECLKCPKCGRSWKPGHDDFAKAKTAIQYNGYHNSY